METAVLFDGKMKSLIQISLGCMIFEPGFLFFRVVIRKF